jgi:peptidyl-prolyl cis-trans isomerase-like 4
MNTSWSNDIKRGPKADRRGAEGYGGRGDLEETRRYRASGGQEKSDGYGMVFDIPEDNRGAGRRRKRSRSDGRERDDMRDRRRRSRSPEAVHRDRERRRSRSRERRRF